MLRTILTYSLIAISSIFVSGLVLEALLRHTRFLDQLSHPSPSYIPHYLYQRHIHADNNGYVDQYGFRSTYATNNLVQTLDESSGCKIVILGDSFIWGSGLALEDAWPSKLQSTIECKIFPFGKPGWSSYQYLDFYKTHLRELQFNYLLISIVANDPHPIGKFGDSEFAPTLYQRKKTTLISEKNRKKYLSEFLVDDYLDSVIGGYLDKRKLSKGTMSAPPILSWGYRNWRNRLYQPDTFKPWKDSIISAIEQSNHTTCVLLTPTSNSHEDIAIFNQISTVFEGSNTPYLNMMPELNAMFDNQLRPRNAWANSSDGHPGIAQNELYAKGAAALLSNCKKN